MAAQSGATAGGVGSVNGKTGNVILDGTDLAYTPFYAGTASTATTVAGQIQHMENHVGPADVVWSEATIDAAAPLAGSTYPLTAPGLWVPPLGGAPITLSAGRDVTMTAPASIDGLGGGQVVLLGDVAAPLLSGEVHARSLTLGNVNAGGMDMQAESLSGRTLINNAVFFVGGNSGVIENIVGAATWTDTGIIAPFPGALGISMDGTIGTLGFSNGVVVPPGTLPHVGFTLEATCTITGLLNWAAGGFTTQVAGDAMIHIDPGATLPTSPVPTSTIGVAVSGITKVGPGDLFSSTGRNETDIRIFSASHLSAPSSRYIGDALYDVTQTVGAPDASLTHAGVSPTVDVVPSDNVSGGGAGATIVTLALDPISERFTLDLTGGAQAWFLRYDGAPGNLRGQIVWRAQVLKGGGAASAVRGFVQESVGGGAFITIPQTGSITRNLVNNIPSEVNGSAPITLSSNHRYRIVMSTTDNAIPTLIRSLTIQIAGSP